MTTSITLALLISIPVAVIEPGFISQSLRAGSKARKCTALRSSVGVVCAHAASSVAGAPTIAHLGRSFDARADSVLLDVLTVPPEREHFAREPRAWRICVCWWRASARVLHLPSSVRQMLRT